MDLYEFDRVAPHLGIGNMKGNMAEETGAPVFLSGAEMDYPTAPVIRERLVSFAAEGLYGFTVADDAYLNAIVRWMKEQRGAEIHPEWIVPTLGTAFGLSSIVRALTEAGEEVLLQGPSYYRFDRAILRNGRKPIYNSLILGDDGYRIDWEDLEEKLSRPGCRLMVLVNPHNPTGKVFPVPDMQKIAELARRHGVTVFSDEIFAETAQPGFEIPPYITVDELGISSTSLGKSFSLTGTNQANLLIPDPALRERILRQRDTDHFGSIDPFFYQALMAAYSPEGAAWLEAMNAHTAGNAKLIEEAFRERMPKLRLWPVEGTFIGWIDCRPLGLDDEQLQRFFEEAGIFADPGIEYGPEGSGFYRWNLGTPRQNIELALELLEAAYGKLNDR